LNSVILTKYQALFCHPPPPISQIICYTALGFLKTLSLKSSPRIIGLLFKKQSLQLKMLTWNLKTFMILNKN